MTPRRLRMKINVRPPLGIAPSPSGMSRRDAVGILLSVKRIDELPAIPSSAMKVRRSKSLEKMARAVHDSDEFVEHIFGIAATYRAQHVLESTAKGAAIRKSLKTFDKHATALNSWLREALKTSHTSAEHEALSQLSTALHGSSAAARAQAHATQLWLASLCGVSERAQQSLKRNPIARAAGSSRSLTHDLRSSRCEDFL